MGWLKGFLAKWQKVLIIIILKRSNTYPVARHWVKASVCHHMFPSWQKLWVLRSTPTDVGKGFQSFHGEDKMDSKAWRFFHGSAGGHEDWEGDGSSEFPPSSLSSCLLDLAFIDGWKRHWARTEHLFRVLWCFLWTFCYFLFINIVVSNLVCGRERSRRDEVICSL